MKGYVFVAPTGYSSDDLLEKWVRWGVEFVSKLPPKKTKPTKPRKGRMTK